eukprot:TRINITY_DN19940_c0_g1_i2.p1 TRINITY_DN19940_c0_g1~~TRINITY_DN19940_c0_g1_i2.p1  ORF type:complete len:334 (+),score=63.90 TRINITY_DN19940_c0_g1_i2:271-1272(+)
MTRRRMAWLRLALAVAACCGPRIAAVPVMSGGRVVDAEAPEVKATVLAARQALSRTGPQGPYGPAAAHVFAFADFFCVMLCHLARTVEAAGGWLHVLGLRDGAESPLPVSSAPAPGDAETRGDEPWHFPDKAVMLKKHLFLWRAIRSLPANATVIFVDGFDVLFQRPLADVVATYGELAGAAAERNGGVWPVVFGGERNCWPFPHDGGKVHVPQPEGSAAWVHEIAPDAALSANHSGQRRYPYGSRVDASDDEEQPKSLETLYAANGLHGGICHLDRPMVATVGLRLRQGAPPPPSTPSSAPVASSAPPRRCAASTAASSRSSTRRGSTTTRR